MFNKRIFVAQDIAVIKNYHVLLDPSDWSTRHVSEQSSHLDILYLLSFTFIGSITTHNTCDLLFCIKNHLLYPIWWRPLTLGKHVSRDLSFFLLQRTLWLTRRWYRRYCYSRLIMFWYYINCTGMSFDSLSQTLWLNKLDCASDTSIELTDYLRDDDKWFVFDMQNKILWVCCLFNTILKKKSSIFLSHVVG